MPCLDVGMAATAALVAGSLAAWLAVVSAGEHWGYKDNNPEHWKTHFPFCGGYEQSPIDFVTANMQKVKYPPLRLHHYTHTPVSTLIKNNGHSLYVEVTQAGLDPVMTEGGLIGDYVFHSLHFHWGSNSQQGSEHLVNGRRFPMEMHLVHSNARYGSINSAMPNSDGLAVLSVLFEVSSEDNEALDVLLGEADDVEYSGKNVTLNNPPFTLKSLLPSTAEFFRYKGSLTTPTCDEIVTWTVLEARNKVSERQLKKLRTMKSGEHGKDVTDMSDNFRPEQDLRGRTVFRRDTDYSLGSGVSLHASVFTIVIASLLSSLS